MLVCWFDARRSLPLFAAMGFAACGPQLELDSETEARDTESETMSGSGSPMTMTSVGDSSTGGPVPTVREVDIMFVVDNSGSMGAEQAKLATAIGNLVVGLDAAEPPIDYRIAVTTTDNGNPWCQGTLPEAGNFRATSCIERLPDFVFEGAVFEDAFQIACTDICALEELALPEPWVDVQRSLGTTNVPGDVVVDALRCMLPQGINGCGFEQPLESLYKAILRTETEGEANFGFRREGALLAVAIVTDEADCSNNPDHETIFLSEGNRVFWSDPEAPAPTSAVCWNAGVTCSGSGNPYDECVAIDRNEDAMQVEVDAASDAVLYPVIRYTAQLAEQGVYVIAIDGVGPGGVPVYADALGDPAFQQDFGIGPGCEAMDGSAVPPVRIRDVIATVGEATDQFSVCDAGFEAAMNAFANGIVARLP